MKVTISAILGAALLAGSAMAGPAPVYEKGPVIQDPVCAVPFTGTVSVGYETAYIFRGENFGDYAPWAGADFNMPLSGSVSLNAGVWYINPTQFDGDPTDELDVYAFLNFPLWIFDASFGGTWYAFPEADNDGNTGELALILSKDIGLAVLSAMIVRDFEEGDGWYFEYGASKTIALADCLDLNLGAGIAHTADYFDRDGLNHAYVTGGVTYHLTENASIDAYIGGNFPLDELDDAGEEDEVHGGVSLSVSF